MSSSLLARIARTTLIRPPKVGAGSLGRSFVFLAAKPMQNVCLRPTALPFRQMSALASVQARGPNVETSTTAEAEEEILPLFSTLDGIVDRRVLRAITQDPFNLTTMSPVQAQVLPLLPEIAEPYKPEMSSRAPRDLLVRAKTGTGKTLAFLVPAVEARLKAIKAHAEQATRDSGLSDSKRFDRRAGDSFARKNTGAVIISPTRELATQIAKEAIKLTEHLPGFEVHLFVGGESKSMQLRNFKRGSHDIIVATPGRLNDLLTSSQDVANSIEKTQLLILDEADTLLDMGFQPDILAIQNFMPKAPQRQTWLFSATVSPAIRDIARASLDRNHRFINCVSANASPVHAHIPQYHTVLPSAEHQIPHVLRLLAHDQLGNPGKSKSIVFLPTTKMTQLFSDLLREVSRTALPAGRNTQVYEIHSKRSMESRVRASNHFRNDTSGASILVTSDVSARGVDYPGVTRVIQVGVPSSAEQYIHRVGRTGRAGTSGRGDLVLLPWERGFVTWQMGSVPLKPLTVDDHSAQTLELAQQHDQNPEAFFGGSVPTVSFKQPTSSRSSFTVARSSSVRSRPLIKGPVAPVVEDINRSVTELLGSFDEEAVNETFMSLVGYYAGRTADMRASKLEVVDGCKNWAVQACGLPQPPILSQRFLEKLGMADPKKWDRVRKGGFKEPRENAWASRGGKQVRERDNERGRENAWAPRGGKQVREWDNERETENAWAPRGTKQARGRDGERGRDSDRPHWMGRGSRSKSRRA